MASILKKTKNWKKKKRNKRARYQLIFGCKSYSIFNPPPKKKKKKVLHHFDPSTIIMNAFYFEKIILFFKLSFKPYRLQVII